MDILIQLKRQRDSSEAARPAADSPDAGQCGVIRQAPPEVEAPQAPPARPKITLPEITLPAIDSEEGSEQIVPIVPIVQIVPGDAIVVRRLAGVGQDRFNKYMAKAEELFKEGKYYDAAGTYELASMTKPANPLARVGAALSLLAAGESLSAAVHMKRAIRLFPPLMETRLDVEKLLGRELLNRRLERVELLIEDAQSTVKRDLAFLAAFMHHNAGHPAKARQYAELLDELSKSDNIYQAYVAFILQARRPDAGTTTAPAAKDTKGTKRTE